MEEGGGEKEKGCMKVWKSEEIKGERRCGRGSLKERVAGYAKGLRG